MPAGTGLAWLPWARSFSRRRTASWYAASKAPSSARSRPSCGNAGHLLAVHLADECGERQLDPDTRCLCSSAPAVGVFARRQCHLHLRSPDRHPRLPAAGEPAVGAGTIAPRVPAATAMRGRARARRRLRVARPRVDAGRATPAGPAPCRRQPPPRALSFVVGGGDEFGVFLSPPLEGEKIIVAAAAARIAAAQRRPRFVNRAAPLVDVKEATDAAEDRIGLASHRVLAAPALHSEFLSGRLEAQSKVLGEALDIALVEGDQGIGAAIAGALLAIVHRHSSRAGSGL